MSLRLTLVLLFSILLAACSGPQPAPTIAPTATPAIPLIQSAPDAAPVLPSATVAASPDRPASPSAMPAAGETLPASTATPTPEPASTVSATAEATATATAAATATATRPRPTATSSGPLAAEIYVANCRSAPTAEKPGRVIIQISVEASGGNGKYRYFFQDKESPTKFIDVPGEKGTRSINVVRVTSGDGQTLEKKFDISLKDLNCP